MAIKFRQGQSAQYLNDQQMAAVHGDPSVDHHHAFWAEKLAWAVAGDVTPEGLRVARVRGRHYVINPMSMDRRDSMGHSFLGHGGRIMRFRFLDGTEVESNNVWSQGEIPLRLRAGALADNADIMTEDWGDLWKPAPDLPPATEMDAVMGNLSKFEHPTYRVDFAYASTKDDQDYDVTTVNESREKAPIEQSHVWSSEIASGPNQGMHVLALDVDESVRLVPSSTPGHWHLVIDKPVSWPRYIEVLGALADAGIVERGYFDASIARGHTALRLPWIKKQHLDEKRRADRDAHNLAVEDQANPQAGKFLAFNRDGLAMIVDHNPDPVTLTVDEWNASWLNARKTTSDDPLGF
jgi:hypothetical protein